MLNTTKVVAHILLTVYSKQEIKHSHATVTYNSQSVETYWCHPCQRRCRRRRRYRCDRDARWHERRRERGPYSACNHVSTASETNTVIIITISVFIHSVEVDTHTCDPPWDGTMSISFQTE